MPILLRLEDQEYGPVIEPADDPLSPLDASWQQLQQQFHDFGLSVALDAELFAAPPSALFSALSELKTAPIGAVRVPDSRCFEAIDFGILLYKLFQVTVGRHTIKTNGLRRIQHALDATPGAVFNFYVVAPPDVYGELKSPLSYEFHSGEFNCPHVTSAKTAASKTKTHQCQQCAYDDTTVNQFALLCDPVPDLRPNSAIPPPEPVRASQPPKSVRASQPAPVSKRGKPSSTQPKAP